MIDLYLYCNILYIFECFDGEMILKTGQHEFRVSRILAENHFVSTHPLIFALKTIDAFLSRTDAKIIKRKGATRKLLILLLLLVVYFRQ